MKMQRYDAYHIGLHPSDDGAWCDSEDVARLEASHAELLEALECLTAVIGLTPIKGNLEALQEAYDMARSAIAKAKGEQP
jgi:hypothetical protein